MSILASTDKYKSKRQLTRLPRLSPIAMRLSEHLMRAIRLFIEEGEGTKGKTSVAEATGTSEKTAQRPVTYQVPEPPSALVREEEFAKQLRLARYLAGASLGRLREVEKAGEKARSVSKPKPRAKAQLGNKKGVEAELAREMRRAQQVGRQKGSSSGRGEKDAQRVLRDRARGSALAN